MASWGMSSERPRQTRDSRRRVLRGLAALGGAVVVAGGVTQRNLLDVAVSRAKDAVAGDRVAAARARLGDSLERAAKAKGIPWQPRQVFVRAFKTGYDGTSAGRVEAWVGDGRGPLQLLQVHPLCALSGVVGPKRREGDLQVPEGFYTISAMNPK